MIRNRKHLRQVPNTTPRRDIVVMPPQPLATQHHIPMDSQPVEKPSDEPQTYPDLDRKEIIRSEPRERETSPVQPTERQQ